MRTYGPTPTRTPWRVYGPLEVLVPERAYILILALKLLTHRTQDEADNCTVCQELWIGMRAEPIRAVYLVFSSGEAGLSFLSVEGGAHLVTHLHLKREVQRIWPCQ